jgi:myo-inositol-1(or 4)-monophosphatase
LAYRFALVATGEVDVAIARPGAYDWDLAAADLLVHEAGGRLAGLDGARPRYNRQERRHPALVAATPELSDAMAALVAMAESRRAG